MAEELEDTKDTLRGKENWNYFIHRYFVASPGLIKNNAKVIF